MLNLSSLASSSSSPTGRLAIQNPNKLGLHGNHFLPSKTSLVKSSSSISLPISYKKILLVKCRHSGRFETQQQKFSHSQNKQREFSQDDSSFSSEQGGLPPRVFIGYSIYKGKAAMTVLPRPPEFSSLDPGVFKLSKEGFVLLQFAPAAGVRKYVWGRKQVFALSATEMGHLMSLGAKDSCEFFHDPFMGKSDEGKVRKVLKVEPMPDGSGHFFNLSVQNRVNDVDENISIPITKGEFAVLNSAFNFIIPYLLGWNTFADSIRPDDSNYVNTMTPRSGAELEWSR